MSLAGAALLPAKICLTGVYLRLCGAGLGLKAEETRVTTRLQRVFGIFWFWTVCKYEGFPPSSVGRRWTEGEKPQPHSDVL